MKSIKWDKELPDDICGSDDVNVEDLLRQLDKQLKKHNLEIEILDTGSSDCWFRIIPYMRETLKELIEELE